MRSASWHARIECGNEVGAGFLVSARQVLTCAHVVRQSGAAGVTVSFPHRKELGELSATVAVHGIWAGGAADPGDLAVLELDREVPLAPAVFAPPGSGHGMPSPLLTAYGFPIGYDEGMLAQYRAVSSTLIADEWVQLEAATSHGQPLAAGFSGAAVALADDRVIGMVSAIAGAKDVRVGRMLPTHVMARYWPELGQLVPTPGHHPDAMKRLYTLVRRVVTEKADHDPDRLYVDAVGLFGPPLPESGFASLWDATRYVQFEVPDPEAVTRLTDRLAGLLDRQATVAASTWSPILVELDHSGAGADQVTVEVSACRNGQRRRVGSHRLPRTAVREYVQEHIDEAFTQLAPDADELITFVLPREWLNEPVAQWQCGAHDSTPLGCAYPLVVVDRSRYRRGGLRHQLARKWRKLDACEGTRLHRVECGTAEPPPRLRKLLRDTSADLAGFGFPPATARHVFEAGLNAPVPVLLWPQTGCTDFGHEAPCTGSTFLDELTASVADVPPAQLPRHVMALRETAEADDAPERHWAKNIQLLWDDPHCFPEPAASLHSPVA
jgi:hypothetical protein